MGATGFARARALATELFRREAFARAQAPAEPVAPLKSSCRKTRKPRQENDQAQEMALPGLTCHNSCRRQALARRAVLSCLVPPRDTAVPVLAICHRAWEYGSV